MKLGKDELIHLIKKIRSEIGHKDVDVDISRVIFDDESDTLLIITPDRPEKSVVIGKGGWVVGRLREELKVNSIHVEAYSDYIVPVYRMKLGLEKLEEIIPQYPDDLKEPLINLSHLLKRRIENPYDLAPLLKAYILESNEKSNFKAVVALSGGVDSSSSLIIAQKMGFNPLAVTINPGSIILPRYFRQSVENLTEKLKVEHRYVDIEMDEVVKGALEGIYHPCGRCSKTIEEAILKFTRENNIPFLIFGDLLSTGAKAFQKENGILRINLPALLALKKGDVKKLAGQMDVEKKGGYGCPLIGEVHKKHPHMKRFSIQRVLRETRAGVLEPGEASNQIKGIM